MRGPPRFYSLFGNRLEWWEERAAIQQWDGGLSKGQAELEAFQQVPAEVLNYRPPPRPTQLRLAFPE